MSISIASLQSDRDFVLDQAQEPSPAFLQGASGQYIQAVLLQFGMKLLAKGHRIKGMTERRVPRGAEAQDEILCDIETARTFQLYQDLGKSSEACSLDSSGLAEAAGVLEAGLNSDVEMVIISKFGKEEAAGRGFCSVFQKAILLDIPILTSVNPLFDGSWTEFTGGTARRLRPDARELETWWTECCSRKTLEVDP